MDGRPQAHLEPMQGEEVDDVPAAVEELDAALPRGAAPGGAFRALRIEAQA